MGNSSRKARSGSCPATFSFTAECCGAKSEPFSRSVAERLELRVGIPCRDGVGVADGRAESVNDLGQLCGTTQIEVWPVLVGRLVISVRGVILRLLEAPLAGTADIVDATTDRDRRNPGLGKGEMV